MLCQLALPFERPKLHVWKCDFDLERAGTMWCADASEFHSDPKVWSTVLFGRLRPTTVHRTRPLEHCGPWRATSGQFLCEYPKQGQSPLLQRSALHALLNSCMSAWTHQLHKRNPAAKHGWDYWHVVRDDGCSDGWQVHKVGIHATISTKECYIVHRHWVHKPQQCHHFGEALYGNYLQKPRCMRCLHPKAACCIVQRHCLYKPQQCHHFGEALSGETLQKPGCMRCLHPKAECYILHRDSFHKPQQCHHFGEALYGTYLQIPCQDIRILIGIAILVNDSISGLLQVDCFGPVTQRWCCWLRFAMSKALGQNLCWFMGQTVTECDRYVDVSWGHGQYPRPLNTVCLMAPRSP